jgi:hypothetical protein
MEFYSAHIEMLMSGWNTLYFGPEIKASDPTSLSVLAKWRSYGKKVNRTTIPVKHCIAGLEDHP